MGMTNFRLISLTNIIYKIVAKIIVLKLQWMLPYVMCKGQGAFVKGGIWHIKFC